MHEIHSLEEQWKKYNIKKRKPLFISLVVLGVVLTLWFTLSDKKLSTDSFNKYLSMLNSDDVANYSEDTNKIMKQQVLVNSGLVTLETIIPPVEKNDALLVDVPILDDNEVLPEIKNETNHKKLHLDIIETSSVTAYKDVERRFFQSHDIDDALFLAKSYYKKGNYQEAIRWAIEVNKLDSNIEESIVIFVESKIKLGKRYEALSLLKSYIKRSDSTKARKLLDKIENSD